MGSRGKYIVFEGQDGAGKSVQLSKIAKRLSDEGCPCVLFREPGGRLGEESPLREEIRRLVQSPDMKMTPLCELGLFMANRADLMPEIEKLLNEGKHVICDRNYISSIVYQGAGRGLPLEKILEMVKLFEIREPDFVVLYLCEKGAKDRVALRGDPDRFEREEEGFLTRVSKGYECLPELLNRVHIPHITVDTSGREWESYEEKVMMELKKIL